MKPMALSTVIGCLVAIAVIYVLQLQSPATMALVFALCVGISAGTAALLRRAPKEKPHP